MNTSFRIIAVFLGMFLVARVQATPALEGTVQGSNGRPVAGAEIQIAAPDTGSVLKVARTDAKGHYRSDTMPPQTYRVNLVVNGEVKASIKNVAVSMGDSTLLDFSMRPAGPATPAAKGKHYVWIPASTGSQLAGRWVEVNDVHPNNMPVGMQERIRWQPNEVVRHWQSNSGSYPNGM